MATLTINRPQPKTIEALTPNKDIILITGKVEILGVQLFCGSIVYDTDDGLDIRSCKVLAPDMNLYQGLNREGVEIGSMVEIIKTKNKGSKHLKNSYNINKVETNDLTALSRIKETIDEFDSSWYDSDNVEF
jgi:hypothetical protein